MKKIKIVTIAFFALLAIGLTANYHGNEFRKNHLVTTGVVTGYDEGCGTRWDFGQKFYYQYNADNMLLDNSRRTSELPCSIGKYIVGKSFPVVYKRYWYGYEQNILITPRDFELYGHPFSR